MSDAQITAGGPRVSHIISRMITTGRVPHALLFSGPAGSGRREAARQLAGALLCESPKNRPCGDCLPCQKIAHETHPDYLRLAPEGTRLKIDQIRSLIQTLEPGPYEGTARIAVIEDAETLTPEAGNALLKTLEEPPAKTMLILIVTHEAALVPTLLSRCQRVIFPTMDSLSESQNHAIESALKSLPKSNANTPFRIAQSIDAEKTDKNLVVTSLMAHYEQRMRRGDTRANAALEAVGRAASAFDRHANGRLTLDTLFLKLWDIENQNAKAAQ